MRKRVNNRAVRGLAAFAVFWAAGCFVCAAAAAEAVAADAPASAPPDAITIPLEYTEAAYGPQGVSLATRPQTVAFKKEPVPATSSLRRGRLTLPNGDTESIPFIWDIAKGKLYLDLNRNEDLTDDPAGTLSMPDRTYSSSGDYHFGRFTNAPLTLKTEAGPIPWVADLQFSEYNKRLNVYASVRSFWAGKATIAGREWQVGWLPGTDRRAGRTNANDGWLLLRAWDDRAKSFSVFGGALDAFTFPKAIFLGNTSYGLACQHTPDGGKLNHQIVFKPQRAELGDLIISGKFVKRLLLTGEPCAVVLDSPEGKVRVPVGQYNAHRVQLGEGESLAYLDQPANRALVVKADAPTTLQAGGPLTNTVAVTRQEDSLRLDYLLVGAGGERYASARRDAQHPPQYAVYEGDRRIETGKFEFG